jgi:hypothetical protein
MLMSSVKEKIFMSSVKDATKTVYIIVHGRKQLLEQVKEKLALKGFEKEKMQNASLDKAGNAGEYVAMVWPPMSPKEIVVSEIIGPRESGGVGGSEGMGAWGSVEQKEIYRISL